MTSPVLVTGASGNVGGAAARSLLAAGRAARVAGTDEAVLRTRFPGAEVARLDFVAPRTFAAAVAGTAGLLLVRPPSIRLPCTPACGAATPSTSTPPCRSCSAGPRGH